MPGSGLQPEAVLVLLEGGRSGLLSGQDEVGDHAADHLVVVGLEATSCDDDVLEHDAAVVARVAVGASVERNLRRAEARLVGDRELARGDLEEEVPTIAFADEEHREHTITLDASVDDADTPAGLADDDGEAFAMFRHTASDDALDDLSRFGHKAFDEGAGQKCGAHPTTFLSI